MSEREIHHDQDVKRIDFAMEVIKRKLNTPEGWEWCKWKHIEPDGNLYEGGVPGVKKSGKNKGGTNWRGVQLQSCIVLTSEIEAEKAAWSARTGKCGTCQGHGDVWAGTNFVTGMVSYRTCRKCGGTGTAAHKEAA